MSKENEQANETPENENEQTEEERSAELYEAVSGAIDEVTITPEKPNDDDDKTADSTDEPADATPEDGATDGDQEESPDGQSEDEEGTTDDDSGDEAESGDGASEKDGEDGTKPKEGDEALEEADPVNDPIPESTNDKTKKRIESLIGIIKDKEGAETQRDEILDQITATGAEPEQYAATLGFLKLYNSENGDDRKKALQVARGLVRELALELGEGASVTDLSEHDDLQADVEAGTLTEARAIEIAAGRETKKLQDEKEKARNERAETESSTKANIQKGVTQLDDFEKATRGSDENYDKLRPTFISLLRPMLKRTHPTEWGDAAHEVYEQVKTLQPAPAAAPKPKPKNQPLRPKGGGGGTPKETNADSALDAVNSALENL